MSEITCGQTDGRQERLTEKLVSPRRKMVNHMTIVLPNSPTLRCRRPVVVALLLWLEGQRMVIENSDANPATSSKLSWGIG
eukprot:388235-Amphidinium_carterae.1